MAYIRPERWVPDMPESFRKYDLEVINVDRRRERPEWRKIVLDLEIMLIEEFASNFLDAGGKQEEADAWRQIGRGAYDELQRGVGLSKQFQIVVGRKPL